MPKLLICPACGYARLWSIRRHRRKCKKCRREWSPGTFYPVYGFRLARREWYRIIDTFLRDKIIRAIEKECGIEYRTAQKAVFAIRAAMTHDLPELLSGVYEAAETYVDGFWKNKAIHIRRQKTKRECGTSKQPIFEVIERGEENTSRVRVWLTQNTRNQSLIPAYSRYHLQRKHDLYRRTQGLPITYSLRVFT